MPIRNVLKMINGVLGFNKIHQGDSAVVLKEIPDNIIDEIVTDPPYGYSFMGKDWDKAVPSVEIWRECYRILKPGAFMFVMSAPRQDVLSQMIVRIEKAGFNINFSSIYWTYATGFPKAMNIAKMVDKRLGVKREVVGTNGTCPDIRNNSFDADEVSERERLPINITVATSPQAKALDGSYGGFQPKPAVEIIIVAMKPLSEKTFVDQALTNGKGVTWLDKCRIPINLQVDASQLRTLNRSQKDENDGWGMNDNSSDTPQCIRPDGRFPANLLVSDDCLNEGKITKSSGEQSNNQFRENHNVYGDGLENKQSVDPGLGNSGSYSRYFDLDAWWNKTIENLPENVKKTFPFLIVPKASKSERNKGCEHMQMKNFHPTVKPLKLMCYLIALGSQKGDIVLDPFNGSGTTCLAAKVMERKWIGVDISEEYCKIQAARLGGAPIYKH
jgi:site-specific DNA-methyltransferase (adenine-specific)